MSRSSGSGVKRRFRLYRLTILLALAIISAFFILGVMRYGSRQAEKQLFQTAAETLAVQTEVLNGVLEKYRFLPPLLSRQSDVRGLFENDAPWPVRIANAKAKAEEATGMSGAKEVAFFLADGTLLAAARDVYHPEPPGVDALSEAARHGVLGRLAVALDTPDRAYAFSSGVRVNGILEGIAVAYVGFEGIEATWSLTTNPVFVSDESGIIILTNRPEWRMRPAVQVLGEETRAGHFINLGRELPAMGWELHVLADDRPARTAGLEVAAGAGGVSLLAMFAVFWALNRRERAEMQTRRDRAQALRLERIVRDRTRALSVTNASLSLEVEERKQTEERLKTAQSELVQTAKLAVLGQMAATLSHEMNQPLAAMRTYGANARRLMDMDRKEEAVSTLDRVLAMVDRMAELSGALLSFSRKPGSEKRVVSLTSTLDEALILVRPRAAKSGVRLAVGDGLEGLHVRAGRIRLSQVFVNLFNNAIDAMNGQANAEVRIDARRERDTVVVTVSDNGPGIAEEFRASIFDPFFTTKPQGEGIGIGLSIVYNIVQDFGGTIRLTDKAGPGTVFEIRLDAAEGE